MTITELDLVAQLRDEVSHLRAQIVELRLELSNEIRTRRIVCVDRSGTELLVVGEQLGAA